jgi:GTP-binding protein
MTDTFPDTAALDEDAARLEAGRLLFARPWVFVRGAAGLKDLPPEEGVEVAFAGRSNVGKSSLINALTGQKGLARTSNTPGRTQELNYFEREGETGLRLVDMPGYGFARASKARSEAWTRLVFAYLRGRANLRRVYLLVDARHGPQANDLEVFDLLDKAAVSYQVVLTKADKPKRGDLPAVLNQTRQMIAKRPAAHPAVLVTSAEERTGLEELRAEIAAIGAG